MTGGDVSFRRVEPVDRLTTDEGTLLLYERELIALTPLAAEVFARCARPTTLDVLAAHLGAEFGAPDGTTLEEATRGVVAELVARGVLARDGDREP